MIIKVLLADDHTIVRDGLQSLLEREVGIQVVGVAQNGRETVQLADVLKPDIVIIDITMPQLNGMEATRQILKMNPQVKVIALTMHTGSLYVQGMFNAGASGYLVKNCPVQEIIAAIHTVASGCTYNSAGISSGVEPMPQTAGSDDASLHALTSREREVLQLIAEGKGTRNIANLLSVSVKTVENHRQHIMDKLHIYNVADLTKFAILQGLTPIEQMS